MFNFIHGALCAVSLSAVLAATPAQAGVIHTFTGPWAPTAVNGFENSVQSTISTFSTSVSADGLVLSSLIANNGDLGHPSFFLQNYSYVTVPLLPTGLISYDYAITLFSARGFVTMFDDFGNSSSYASGTTVSGTYSANYSGGYFGYFGVNIDDFSGTLSPFASFSGTASAIVTLTNLSAPVPVSAPGTITLAALGLAALATIRGRQG